jgi:hypothetical protein
MIYDEQEWNKDNGCKTLFVVPDPDSRPHQNIGAARDEDQRSLDDLVSDQYNANSLTLVVGTESNEASRCEK